MAKKLTNDQRIARPEWIEADVDNIVCPDARHRAGMFRHLFYRHGVGRMARIECAFTGCGWHIERPMVKEVVQKH